MATNIVYISLYIIFLYKLVIKPIIKILKYLFEKSLFLKYIKSNFYKRAFYTLFWYKNLDSDQNILFKLSNWRISFLNNIQLIKNLVKY